METRTILSLERGGYTKKSGHLRVCLVYPNRYEVGIANLGFQLLYRLLNTIDGVWCERSFLDAGCARSLETGAPLSSFHLIAVSLPYELDFLNLLAILRKAGIPLLAEERKGSPLLLLGGVAATANPLPYSRFFDLVHIGEADEVLPQLMRAILHSPHGPSPPELAERIPSLWAPDSGGRPRRAWVRDVNRVHAYGPIVTPLSHFKNFLLVDLERGCPFACRFCLARQLYSPYRARDVDIVARDVIASGLASGGVGLIGAGASEVPGLRRLLNTIGPHTKSIGISSLRIDRIRPEILDQLVTFGVKTISIAPEAGTEKLRWVINKQIKDEKILSLGDRLDRVGIRRVRLYFMVGLPFEEEGDVSGIVDLVSRFRGVYAGRIVVSINPFVPKAHTPFERHGMASQESLKRKLSLVKNGLRRLPMTRVIAKSPRDAVLQGILSLGDASAGSLILKMVEGGIGWQAALKEMKIDPSQWIGERLGATELPWDFIDFGVKRQELAESYADARRLGKNV